MTSEPASLLHSLTISDTITSGNSQNFTGINNGVVNFGVDLNAKTKSAEDCRERLFLTDPESDRQKIKRIKGGPVNGTCKWILANELFKSWLNGKNGLLWISGGPGKGKTMLSIFLSEKLEHLAQHDANTEVMYYFCTSEDPKRNNAIAVLRGLLFQIVTKRPILASQLSPYLDTDDRADSTLKTFDTLWILLLKLIRDPRLGSLLCVLDGFDECDDESIKALGRNLVNLYLSTDQNMTMRGLKMLIVSRPLFELRRCEQLKLDPDNNENVMTDVKFFISERVQELSLIDGFNETVRIRVTDTLLRKAEGTFLWVGFVVNELLAKRTCTEILETLESLPVGLDAIYERMLLQIPIKRRAVMHALLSWIILAHRPLGPQELASAIGLEPTEIMTKEAILFEYLSMCGPLLVVHEPSSEQLDLFAARSIPDRRAWFECIDMGEITAVSGDSENIEALTSGIESSFLDPSQQIPKQVVSLVHQSARDYLTREGVDRNPILEHFRIKQQASHYDIARTCIICLGQSELQYRVLNVDHLKSSQHPPLLQYAVDFWPLHAKSSSERAKALLDLFDSSSSRRTSVWQNWRSTYRRKRLAESDMPLLHLACELGIVPWVQQLLGRLSRWHILLFRSWDQPASSDQCRLLERAVNSQHYDVARLLLLHGVDVNARGKFDGRTALIIAAQKDNIDMVNLLLDWGADVNRRSTMGESALLSAIWHQSEPLVQLLLERGADVRVKDNRGCTSLLVAAESFESADRRSRLLSESLCASEGEPIARLLIGCGADIQARDGYGRSVLYVAAQKGGQKLVRLLLEHGACCEDKTSDGQCLLHAAVEGKSLELVELFVKRGVDANYQVPGGLSPLHAAAAQLDVDAGRVLIKAGADINAVDGENRTALQQIIATAHYAEVEPFMKLLLDSGADPDKQDVLGKTALHEAASTGNVAAARLLLDQQATVNCRDGVDQTPLHKAAYSYRVEATERREMMQLLIEHGANLDARDWQGKTALELAIFKHYDEAVRILAAAPKHV